MISRDDQTDVDPDQIGYLCKQPSFLLLKNLEMINLEHLDYYGVIPSKNVPNVPLFSFLKIETKASWYGYLTLRRSSISCLGQPKLSGSRRNAHVLFLFDFIMVCAAFWWQIPGV